MRKSCLYISLLLTVFVQLVQAQKQVANGTGKSNSANGTVIKIIGIPLVFIMPEKGSEDENIMSIMPATSWKVVNVRINAPAYTYSDAKTIKGKIPFLESMYVTNVTGEMLHVFTDPAPALEKCQLSKQAVDQGWIKKSDCLLSRHCLIDQNKQSMQVMPSSQTNILDIGSDEESQGVNVFYDPELTQKSPVYTRSKQLYYIYRFTQKSVLIGIESKVGLLENARDILLGWIPLSYCFIPANRIWMSPNQDPDAVNERKEKGIVTSLFVDETRARQFQAGEKVPKNYASWQDSREDQFPPNWFRFPLIATNQGILKLKIVDKDFVTAYAPLKINGFSNPLFISMTLISHTELSDVISNMNRLIDASNSENRRKNIQEAILALMSGDYSGLDEERLLNLSFRQVFENLFWICNSESPLMKMKIKQLSDPISLPNIMLNEVFSQIKTKQKELNLIANSQMEKYSFTSNNNRYFWITTDRFY